MYSAISRIVKNNKCYLKHVPSFSHFSLWYHLVCGIPTHFKKKYESQWEGLSHVLWKIKHVWSHQPVIVDLWIFSSSFPFGDVPMHTAFPSTSFTCRNFGICRQGRGTHVDFMGIHRHFHGDWYRDFTSNNGDLDGNYPLAIYHSYWEWPIEIVNLPGKYGGFP